MTSEKQRLVWRRPLLPYILLSLKSKWKLCDTESVLLTWHTHTRAHCWLTKGWMCVCCMCCLGSTATVRTTAHLICTCHWHSKCIYTHTHTLTQPAFRRDRRSRLQGILGNSAWITGIICTDTRYFYCFLVSFISVVCFCLLSARNWF